MEPGVIHQQQRLKRTINAYFQCEELDRLLLLNPPKGIPDPEYEDGEAMILARVPIYGLLVQEKILAGIRLQRKHDSKSSILEEDGDIKGMLITHVDDLCWAMKPGY